MSNNKVTVGAILYTSRALNNGTYPVKLRLTFQRKRKYYSINLNKTEGIYLSKNDWDKVISKSPRKEELKKIKLKLNEYELLANETINEIENSGIPFSFSLFEKNFFKERPGEGNSKDRFIIATMEKIIKEKKDLGAIGTADIYSYSKNKLNEYLNKKDITFDELDTDFLMKYESYLNRCNDIDSKNTINIYMRQIRAAYNRAIKDGFASRDRYPFRDYIIPKESGTTKRALKKEEVLKIYNYKTKKGSEKWKAKNYFMLSYFLQGINFFDICRLKNKNIVDGRIYYERKKTTGKSVKPVKLNIKISSEIQQIIDCLHSGSKKQNDYVFPIFNNSMDIIKQKYVSRQFIKETNEKLKEIGKELKLKLTLTSYVARHSYATVLKRSGVSTSIISEAMGHTSERTTQIYLDSFENETLDKANQLLL